MDIKTEFVREIVNNLFAGMSLERIPTDYYQYIEHELFNLKNDAVKNGNVNKVKKIHSFLKQLNPYSRKIGEENDVKNERKFCEASAQTESLRTNIKQLKMQNYEDIEAISIGQYSDPVSIQKTLETLKKRREISLLKGEYKEAQVIENALHRIHSEALENIHNSSIHNKILNLEKQIDESEYYLESRKQKWNKFKNKFMERMEKALLRIEENHLMQLAEFENRKPKTLPPKYRKISSKILLLREQEKHLILSKRFEDAIPFKEKADKLEQLELEIQKQKYDIDYKSQYYNIKNNQKKEKECFNKKWDTKLKSLLMHEQKEIEAINKRIMNIRHTIKELSGQDSIHDHPLMVAPPDSSYERGKVIAASKLAYNTRFRNIM